MEAEEALGQVAVVSRKRQVKDAERSGLRGTQHAAMTTSLEAGATAHAIAQASGLMQRAIHRVRDGEIG